MTRKAATTHEQICQKFTCRHNCNQSYVIYVKGVLQRRTVLFPIVNELYWDTTKCKETWDNWKGIYFLSIKCTQSSLSYRVQTTTV
jgi:hypothetical protein